jgi:hypothetical protein
MVSELDDFVAQAVERLSAHDPVTLFPASQPGQTGWTDVGGSVHSGLSGFVT